MKTETTNRVIIRNWVIVIAAAVAGLALGCLLSGDDPLRFLFRLFTMAYVPKLETGATLVTVAVFGFLTSFHCIGMCGGVILSQCAGREKGAAAQGLLYNAGRIASCTLVGFLAGLLGRVIGLNGHLKALVPLVLAAVMLVMGLHMLGLLRWLGGRLGIAEPRFLKKLQGKGAFVVGFATGFMPCGMLQVAQLYALGTGSPLLGALSMLVFAVASSPVLLAFGTLAGSLSMKKRVILMKTAAVIVLLLAVKLLLKSLTLMGVV